VLNFVLIISQENEFFVSELIHEKALLTNAGLPNGPHQDLGSSRATSILAIIDSITRNGLGHMPSSMPSFRIVQ
jgi:hypothetical protein